MKTRTESYKITKIEPFPISSSREKKYEKSLGKLFKKCNFVRICKFVRGVEKE